MCFYVNAFEEGVMFALNNGTWASREAGAKRVSRPVKRWSLPQQARSRRWGPTWDAKVTAHAEAPTPTPTNGATYRAALLKPLWPAAADGTSRDSRVT